MPAPDAIGASALEIYLISLLTPSPLLALAGLTAWTAWAYRHRARTPGRRGISAWLPHALAAVTAWAWLCCIPAIPNLLIAHLEGPVQGPHELATATVSERLPVIVLASGQMASLDGRAAPRLDENGWERLRDAVAWWRRAGTSLIVTGGPGFQPPETLAGQMAQAATAWGVPASQIQLAMGSRNTFQDLQAAKALIGDGPVWLVTSAVHMPRALAVCRALGIDARPVPVDFRQIANVTWRSWLPDNGSSERMNTALHELVGRAVYRARGWAR